jgi:hypothetical protein
MLVDDHQVVRDGIKRRAEAAAYLARHTTTPGSGWEGSRP